MKITINIFLFFIISSICISQNDTDAFIFYKNKKVYIYNKKINKQIETEYNTIKYLKNNLFLVYNDSLYGLIDNKANIIIKCEYRKIKAISNNFFLLYETSKKIKIFDLRKNKITQTTFNKYSILNHNIYIIESNNKLNLTAINIEQNIIKQLDIDSINLIYTQNTEKSEYKFDKYVTKYTVYNKIGNTNININNFYIITKNQKKGIISNNLQIFRSPLYDTIHIVGSFFILYSNKELTVINQQNKEILKADYDSAYRYNDSLLVIKKGQNIGLINKNGILINAEYRTIKLVEKGYIINRLSNRNYGFCDLKGNIVLEPKYNKIVSYGKYLLVYLDVNHCGIFDYKGNELIETVYKHLEQIEESNLFYYCFPQKTFRNRFYFSSKNWGVINTFGEIILDAKYSMNSISVDFNDKIIKAKNYSGLMLVWLKENNRFNDRVLFTKYRTLNKNRKKKKSPYYWDIDKNKYGLLGKNRKKIIDYIFNGVTDFKLFENVSKTHLYKKNKKNYYGLVNTLKGKTILYPIYERFLTEDLNKVDFFRCVDKRGKYTIVKKTGETINLRLVFIDDFGLKYMRVASKGEYYFAGNNPFSLEVPGFVPIPKYEKIRNSVYHRLTIKNAKWRIINKNGDLLTKRNYRFIQRYFNNVFIAVNGRDNWGVINSSNKRIIPFKYNLIEHFFDNTKKYEWIESDYFKAKKGNNFGVINYKNKTIIKFQYQDIKYLPNDFGTFFAAKKASKWGLVDKNNIIIIPFEFDNISYISADNRNLFKVYKKNIRKGYLKINDSLLSKPQFIEASDFVNGYAVVRNTDKKYKFIKTDGTYLSENSYDYAKNFNNNLALVINKRRYGYIDKNGNQKIDFMYYDAKSFSEGMAAVKLKYKRNIFSSFKKQYGYIDTLNNIVIKPKYKYASRFTNGLAVVKYKKKYGIIDKNSKYLLKTKYKYISDFKNGFAVFKTFERKSGVVKNNGEIIVEAKFYSDIKNYSNGLAKYRYKSKYGFIDTNGREVIVAKYSKISHFSDNLARFKKGRYYGYLCSSDSIVIGAKFRKASNFYEGYAYVTDKQRKKYLINKKAKKINNIELTNKWLLKYNKINPLFEYFSNKKLESVIIKNKKVGIIDKKGNYIIYPKYNGLSKIDNKIIICTINGYYGIYNSEGQTIAPVEQISITKYSKNYYQLLDLAGMKYCSSKGEIIE